MSALSSLDTLSQNMISQFWYDCAYTESIAWRRYFSLSRQFMMTLTRGLSAIVRLGAVMQQAPSVVRRRLPHLAPSGPGAAAKSAVPGILRPSQAEVALWNLDRS